MEKNEISGQRQFDFVSRFNYIREAGTSGEAKAASAIQEALHDFGMESCLERFSFDTFEIKTARLLVTEPYEKEYRVTGYIRSGNTLPTGIEAEFFYAENGDDISLSYAKNKIVMINNPVNKEMYRKIVQAGAVAFISITGTPVDEGKDLETRTYSLPLMEASLIQGVNIHYKDAVEMVTKGASKVKIIVEQDAVKRSSANVLARIEGTDKAEEILTLTAHYDSVPEGPGAYDNMAGCAVIMELCRYFKKYRPRRTMEFVWFGAEEKGLLGSRNYVDTHKNELYKHQFNMNVDLAGQLVGGTVIGVTGEEAICHMLNYLANEIGIGMSVKNSIWGSDSNTFAWKGIPAMTLNRDGFGMHTCHDVVEYLSPWSLKRSAILLGHIAESLGNIATIPFSKTIPDKLKKELDHYFS